MSYLCRYILLTLLFQFAFFIGLGQESYVISCQVVDDVRGKPLPNVYVALNNTRKGTSTSARGVFKIEVAENELNNDLFLSYTGYYDTLIPCRQLLNSDQILLRSFKVELQDIDVVAELNKEICFGDTAYMFSDEATKSIPYHLDYGHSVGCILKNKSWGYIEKIYLNIANDNYFGAKFAVRIKRIQHSKKYWLGIKNLNLFKDVVVKPIVIEPEMVG